MFQQQQKRKEDNMKKSNYDVREYANKKDIRLWQIADRLGITDNYFSRKLRKEFSEEEKQKIFKIIDELANE